MDKQEKNMDFQGSGSTTYDTVKGTHDTEFIKITECATQRANLNINYEVYLITVY